MKIPENLIESKKLLYSSGYKYLSEEHFYIKMGFSPEEDIITEYGFFLSNGWIGIWKGYAWDGASGPTVDSKSSLIGSLVHDFLYQLMRLGLLQRSFRKKADLAIYYLIKRDGMSWFRAQYWYRGVRIGAGKYVKASEIKKILSAP